MAAVREGPGPGGTRPGLPRGGRPVGGTPMPPRARWAAAGPWQVSAARRPELAPALLRQRRRGAGGLGPTCLAGGSRLVTVTRRLGLGGAGPSLQSVVACVSRVPRRAAKACCLACRASCRLAPRALARPRDLLATLAAEPGKGAKARGTTSAASHLAPLHSAYLKS
jgi:hypothetical protein